MELPKRKSVRLQGYDYTSPGAYFVTICTHSRKKVLCDIVGEGLCALPQIRLTAIGKRVEECIRYMENAYPTVSVSKYVIMPNHIHLLLKLQQNPNETGGHGGPPLQTIIGKFKSYTTRQYNGTLWQRSFYDHIIRNEQDYLSVWEYIENNPRRWQEDRYFSSDII